MAKAEGVFGYALSPPCPNNPFGEWRSYSAVKISKGIANHVAMPICRFGSWFIVATKGFILNVNLIVN